MMAAVWEEFRGKRDECRIDKYFFFFAIFSDFAKVRNILDFMAYGTQIMFSR